MMDKLSKLYFKIRAYFEPKVELPVNKELIEVDFFSNLNKELYVNNKHFPDELYEQGISSIYIRYNKEKDAYRLLIIPYYQKYTI